MGAAVPGHARSRWRWVRVTRELGNQSLSRSVVSSRVLGKRASACFAGCPAENLPKNWVVICRRRYGKGRMTPASGSRPKSALLHSHTKAARACGRESKPAMRGNGFSCADASRVVYPRDSPCRLVRNAFLPRFITARICTGNRAL